MKQEIVTPKNTEKDIAIVAGKTENPAAFRDALVSAFGISGKVTRVVNGRNKEEHSLPEKVIILAMKSNAYKNALEIIKKNPNKNIVLTSKGLDSEILYQQLSDEEKDHVFILSGPNLAEQMETGSPTATIIAGKNWEKTLKLQKELNGKGLRIYASNSPEVIQLSGILKNLMTFELGMIWDKLKDEEKVPMLQKALEAGYSIIGNSTPEDENPQEYWGIAGLGDILLCLEFFEREKGSRNFRGGRLMDECNNEKKVAQKLGTVEGLTLHKKMAEDALPDNYKTSKFKEFISLQKSILRGKISDLKVEPILNQEEMSTKKIFATMHHVFEKFANEETFEGNTKAWFFCRCFQELKKISSYPPDIILRAMLEHVLLGPPIKELPLLENLTECTDAETFPILCLTKLIQTGEILPAEVQTIFMNRNTQTEGFNGDNSLKGKKICVESTTTFA